VNIPYYLKLKVFSKAVPFPETTYARNDKLQSLIDED